MTTSNTLKTVFLLGLLSAILIVGGQALAGRSGMYIGLVMAVVMNFGSYFFSEKIALSMYNAQPVTPDQNPDVYRRVQPMVANLCQRMGLPMPKLWLIAEESPNAFATGRNPTHASVAFTSGVLTLMDDRELERPREFRLNRKPYQNLLFGYGLHTCFGRYINAVQIPLIVKPLLARPALRRADGEAGVLQRVNSFPSSLGVEFE